MTTIQRRLGRPLVHLALGVGGAFGAIATFAIAKETLLVDPLVAKRGVAIALGVTLAVLGNFIPKIGLGAPNARRSESGAAERFAGRALLLAGLVFAALWAFAPLESAQWVSSLVGLVAFAAAALNWASSLERSRRASSGPVGPRLAADEAELVAQGVLLILLGAVFGTLFVFLADGIWGDSGAQWVAIIVTLLIGLGTAWWSRHYFEIRARRLEGDRRRG